MAFVTISSSLFIFFTISKVEIKSIENIYSTPSGYKYIIILTICVDGNMSTFDSHNLADSLEKNIKSLDNVSNVIIHVNPI